MSSELKATIDETLEILAGTDPEYGATASDNHGPIAAEALFALNRPETAVPWVESYKTRLGAPMLARFPISTGNWREAPGDPDGATHWLAFFDQKLAETAWQDVIANWAPVLASELMSVATHGMIRTGHAVRSIAQSQTAFRIHELAEGLACWASRYLTLPGKASKREEICNPFTALDHVQRIHDSDSDSSGSIFQQIRGLDDHPDLSGAIGLVDTGGNLSAFIPSITVTFAGVYLAN